MWDRHRPREGPTVAGPWLSSHPRLAVSGYARRGPPGLCRSRRGPHLAGTAGQLGRNPVPQAHLAACGSNTGHGTSGAHGVESALLCGQSVGQGCTAPHFHAGSDPRADGLRVRGSCRWERVSGLWGPSSLTCPAQDTGRAFQTPRRRVHRAGLSARKSVRPAQSPPGQPGCAVLVR